MNEKLTFQPFPPPLTPDEAGGTHIGCTNPLILDRAPTGDQILDLWENTHGDTNVPTVLRNEGKSLPPEKLQAADDFLGT